MEIRSLCLLTFTCLAALPVAAQDTAETSEEIIRLEDFVTRESALADEGDLLPTSRPTYSVFGLQPALEVPRSVMVLTRELMETMRIEDFSDLDRIGAGTQAINYYGMAGVPVLRGAKGGVFFNGMQRAYQRNEMPLSFGSVDAMDVVKGPAPAHMGPSQAGGYVSMIPKAPYFDRPRSSLRLGATQTGQVRAQFDQGGPFLAGGAPAAYRLSLTAQDGETYYDGVRNDFVSLYGTVKLEPSRGLSLQLGGEYFDFRSNENAGWNRVTQALIDRGEYIVGEPLSIVSPVWGGVADRSLLNVNPALVVAANLVDEGVNSGFITPAQREAMLNLADVGERAQAYGGFSALQLAGIEPSTSGYQYTPEYFAAGGRVFTQRIKGDTVLRDPIDRADSRSLLLFGDLENRFHPEHLWRVRVLVDALETDKLSSYGYALDSRQLVTEVKGTLEGDVDWLGGMTYNTGISLRRVAARVRQDFSVEPFSRRDITRAAVSPNTVILSGPQRGPDGLNFWSPSAQGGANAQSELWQASGFGYVVHRIHPRLTVTTSLLGAFAPYRTRYPSGVDRVPADDPRRTPLEGDRTYGSASLSPVFAVSDQVRVYATGQQGVAIDPHQGGAITGRDNFTRNQLLEAGAKVALADGRFFASGAVYKWRQERFDPLLAVAEPLEGEGWELESTWAPGGGLTLIGSVGAQRMWRLANLTALRAMPLADWQYALYGGVFNNAFGPAYFNLTEGRRPAANPNLEYPGFPGAQAKLLAVWRHSSGLGLSGGPVWSEAAWHNFDRTLRLPSSLVWSAAVSWRRENWSAEIACDNVTAEDYFLGAEPVFGANTLLTKAPGRMVRLTLDWKF